MTEDEKQVFDYVDHFMQGPYYTEFLDLSFPGKVIYRRFLIRIRKKSTFSL